MEKMESVDKPSTNSGFNNRFLLGNSAAYPFNCGMKGQGIRDEILFDISKVAFGQSACLLVLIPGIDLQRDQDANDHQDDLSHGIQ